MAGMKMYRNGLQLEKIWPFFSESILFPTVISLESDR